MIKKGVLFVFFLLIASSFVSAGFFSQITGFVTSGTCELLESDFNDGKADEWDFTDETGGPVGLGDDGPWDIGQSDYLGGSGHVWANVGSENWEDYVFEARVRLEEGVVHANFRKSSEGRYFFGIEENLLYLSKEKPWGTFHDILETEADISLNEWYDLRVEVDGGNIKINIGDDQLIHNDVDPLLTGNIAFEVLEESLVWMDDVYVVGDCVTPPECNDDDFCDEDAGEHNGNCPDDCFCGNGICEFGENCRAECCIQEFDFILNVETEECCPGLIEYVCRKGECDPTERICAESYEYCGDGIVQYGEECDDGNDDYDDGCFGCKIEELDPVCGDGYCDQGEDCEEDCDTNCIEEGEFIIDMGSEECCSGLLEFECMKGECDPNERICAESYEYCGDGIVQYGEECDDGNDEPDDGCINCEIEDTEHVCGDNVCDFGENCPEDCENTCNNGIKDINEEGIDCGGPCYNQDCCKNRHFNDNEDGLDCGGECSLECKPAFVDGAFAQTNGPFTDYNPRIFFDPDDSDIIYTSSNTGNGILISRDKGESWQRLDEGVSTPYVFDFRMAPSNHDIMYASTADGRVYKSNDRGRNWYEVSGDLPVDVLGLWSLAIHPEDPNTVYVGTGSYTWHTDGIYKTTNSGRTWQKMDLPREGKFISAIVIDKIDPDIVYATTGIIDACMAGSRDELAGVFKTEDGGQTWVEANNGLLERGVSALIIDPRNHNTIYAGTGCVDFEALPGGQVYKSYDRGNNWIQLSGPDHSKQLVR